MVYKKDLWIAAVNKAITDLKTDKPTSGLPCAIAGLRYVRDALLDDLGAGKHDVNDIRESFGELIKALSSAGSVDDGFLSNASAAAKAAGHKSTTEKVLELAD